jgi:hypothetical protein
MGRFDADEMTIRIDSSTLRQTSWRGHVTRFAIGGAVTVLTGLIGKAFGARAGGVFLALPAVFPVSVYMMGRLKTRRSVPVRAATGLVARLSSMPPAPRWEASECLPSPLWPPRVFGVARLWPLVQPWSPGPSSQFPRGPFEGEFRSVERPLLA